VVPVLGRLVVRRTMAAGGVLGRQVPGSSCCTVAVTGHTKAQAVAENNGALGTAGRSEVVALGTAARTVPGRLAQGEVQGIAEHSVAGRLPRALGEAPAEVEHNVAEVQDMAEHSVVAEAQDMPGHSKVEAQGMVERSEVEAQGMLGHIEVEHSEVEAQGMVGHSEVEAQGTIGCSEVEAQGTAGHSVAEALREAQVEVQDVARQQEWEEMVDHEDCTQVVRTLVQQEDHTELRTEEEDHRGWRSQSSSGADLSA